MELATAAQGAAPLQLAAPGPKPEPQAGGQRAVAVLVEQLVMLAAFVKELESQAHLIHLNFEGPEFLAVHSFLKEQYEQHLAQFDLVGEFVRSLDFWMPLCSCGLKEAVCGFAHVESHQGRAMLVTYFQNLEAMGYLAKAIEQVAVEVEAPDVAHGMAELVGDAFKASWFLKATLRSTQASG